jgi:hypothetical protein
MVDVDRLAGFALVALVVIAVRGPTAILPQFVEAGVIAER